MSRPETIRVNAPDGRVIHYPIDMHPADIQAHLDSIFTPTPEMMSAHKPSPPPALKLWPAANDPIPPSTIQGGGVGTMQDFNRSTPNTIAGQLGGIGDLGNSFLETMGALRRRPDESEADFNLRREENMGMGLSLHAPGEGAAEPFFSQLSKTIDEKMPNAALPHQVANIARSGAKAEELAWSGLDDWLKQQSGKVSKQDVMQYLREHEVKVNEVWKGVPTPISELIQRRSALRPELDQLLQDHDNLGFDTASEARRAIINHPDWDQRWDVQNPRLVEIGHQFRDLMSSNANAGAAKFNNYQLDGPKGDYGNLLLTLPKKPNPEWRVLSKNEYAEKRVLTDWVKDFVAVDRNGDMIAGGSTPDEALANAAKYHDVPGQKLYKSTHFDEPNILAHVRFNDRVDPATGKKMLFIEEIQSDWHQAGRKQGYAPEIEKRMDELDQLQKQQHGIRTPEQREEYNRLQTAWTRGDDVPDAPFKTSWHELAMKRMMRYAAENGYDQIGWTTGAQQVARYENEFRKAVDAVHWHDKGDHHFVSATKNGRVVWQDEVTPDGTTFHDFNEKRRSLDEIVGKDIAKQILKGEGKAAGDAVEATWTGKDLTIGGEGMKGFYDKMLPDFVNKYGKKWDARARSGAADVSRKSYEFQPSSRHLEPTIDDVEKAYQVSRERGRILESPFTGEPQEYQVNRVVNSGGLKDVLNAMKLGVPFKQAMQNNGNASIAQLFGGDFVNASIRETAPIHTVDITPKMRASVMEKGQPLFAGVPMLPRLKPGPFGAAGTLHDSDKKKYKRITPSAPPPARPPE